ncbi:MAG: hypothetical protein JKY45_01335 [Emcibacter sp.]|nr:hypothetical protein [Emcibacter sp.]
MVTSSHIPALPADDPELDIPEPEMPELDINAQDLKTIRQTTLSNISHEILQISDLVENSMVDLSDDFMQLVQYSRKQVEDMTAACDLLQGEYVQGNSTSRNKVYNMLRETTDSSITFHKNVNKMIYSMQFQDRARQLMQAVSVALNILINLSDTVENTSHSAHLKEKVTFSKDNKNILNKLIKATAHKELDQNYILRMFLGPLDKKNETHTEESSDFTDVEFF